MIRATALALVLGLAGCAMPGSDAGQGGPADGAPQADAIDADGADAGAGTDAPEADGQADAPAAGGFLARLFRPVRADAPDAPAAAPGTPPDSEAGPTGAEAAPDDAGDAVEADETVVAQADAALDAPAGRGGGFLARLFGGGGARAGDRPDGALDAALPAGALPYGDIGVICGNPARTMGEEIARHPADRGAHYRLYDSAPGTTEPRSFFLDGFDDGCVRQFSAALVVFGTAPTYEAIRYGAAAETQVLDETDEAYDRIKRRVCGVGPRRACGDNVDRLSDQTVFVSVYERHGSNLRWKNILLHDGAVEAVDIVSR